MNGCYSVYLYNRYTYINIEMVVLGIRIIYIIVKNISRVYKHICSLHKETYKIAC